VSDQPVDIVSAYLQTRKSPVPHGIQVSLSLFLFIWCSRTWDRKLSLSLQEGGVSLDELVGGDIANGNTSHFGGGSGGLAGRRWW
jgi:hypothetical protein